MAEPIAVRKITLRLEALRQLTPERRSALLLVGLFFNEINWLRKLLVRAADAISNSPEGEASYSLTLMLATITAAKAHEGWNRLANGDLAKAINELPPSEAIDEAREKVGALLVKDSIAHVIRNDIAFHYPTSLDIDRLTQLSDLESHVLLTDDCLGAHMMSNLSTMAVVNMLLGMASDGETWQRRVGSTIRQVAEVAVAYSDYVAMLQITMISNWIPVHLRPVEGILIPDPPPLTPDPMIFFAHPVTGWQ